MLTFKFSGADGVMTVAETLTSGMVGKQVKLEFTSDWDNLTKTAVFEAGDISEAVYNVSDTVAIPEAVLAIARRRLRVGIYGEDAEGNITPTVYAIGPRIEEGADPYRASGDPPMPKWKELEERIEDLENGNSGGGSGSDSSQNAGLNETARALLITILRNGIYSTDQSANISALEAALASSGDSSGEDSGGGDNGETEKTLSRISATYSGGDVAVGTAVSDLTGIVVTAHYSDDTSATVTGYTLSGTIAEGSNTITVSYGGKTTTFTVTGTAESAGDDEKAYITKSLVWENNKYCTPQGEIWSHDSRRITDYFDITGYGNVVLEDIADTALLSENVSFWDADKTFISRGGGFFRISNAAYPSPKVIPIPENAVYARIDGIIPDDGKFVVYLN